MCLDDFYNEKMYFFGNFLSKKAIFPPKFTYRTLFLLTKISTHQTKFFLNKIALCGRSNNYYFFGVCAQINNGFLPEKCPFKYQGL
jgi:hypothetical protein